MTISFYAAEPAVFSLPFRDSRGTKYEVSNEVENSNIFKMLALWCLIRFLSVYCMLYSMCYIMLKMVPSSNLESLES